MTSVRGLLRFSDGLTLRMYLIMAKRYVFRAAGMFFAGVTIKLTNTKFNHFVAQIIVPGSKPIN